MSESQQAWYRHGWPWVLIGIPFAAVLFGVFMVVVAAVYPDDLVADDYYKDGMAINRDLEMDEKAKALGIRASATVLDEGTVSFVIDGARDSAVLMNLYHVTDRARDASLVLYPEGGRVYRSVEPIPVATAEPGVWYIELLGADDNWRLRKRLVTPAVSMELVAK